MNEKSLAYEMLEELKRVNKRLFTITIIELIIIVSMIIGYFIYNSQFDYEDKYYTQETYDNNNSSITQNIE